MVISIVLARILGPADYGVVAIVMIFITFANVFVSDGFGVRSLVAQYLIGTLISTATLGVVLQKKPQLIFSFDAIKKLLPFGMRVLGVGLLITGYQETKSLNLFYLLYLMCFIKGGKHENHYARFRDQTRSNQNVSSCK